MKVICLVPSLTETLILCGIEVVGRTRFCFYPKEIVSKIPILGGAKSVNWEKAPVCDLVVFDREENNKAMAESCPYPWYASHVTDLPSLRQCFLELSEKLKSKALLDLAHRMDKVLAQPKTKQENLAQLPGVISKNPLFGTQTKLRYLIWKKPYMEISKNTFIGSVLIHLGFEALMENLEKPYPELQNLPSPDTGLLLSSEPYPFGKEWDEDWYSQEKPCALIDGELYSWFGIRSLLFLEKECGLS